MANIFFCQGNIELSMPPKKVSKHCKSPGKVYMDAAYSVVEAIREYLADYGELPDIQDVAGQLKELFGRSGGS